MHILFNSIERRGEGVAYPEESQLKVVVHILVFHVVHSIAGDPCSGVHVHLQS